MTDKTKKYRGLFVTGTDTSVGKTVVSAILCSAITKFCNERSGYFKPIQTGQDNDTQEVKRLVPEVLHMSEAYRLQAPMSPDRAATLEGVTIELQHVVKSWEEQLKQAPEDVFWIIEGAGGLMVPLNDSLYISDMVKAINLPLVIVASTQLGTINHSILTCLRAKEEGVDVKGFILVGDMDEGLDTLLEQKTDVPVLFRVPILPACEVVEVDKYVQSNLQNVDFNELIANNNSNVLDDFQVEKGNLWLPFTQHGLKKKTHCVRAGKDSCLYLQDGSVVIDAIASWWVNLHGHANRVIAEAIYRQASCLEQVIFANFQHEGAVALSEILIESVENQLDKVFYSDNGSTAVEVALKMAYQYHVNQGETTKQKFLALQGGYHGDTLGAMSVSEREGFHSVFHELMFDVDYVALEDFDALDALDASKVKNTYAGFIVEPLIQGAGGMRCYSVAFLQAIARFCKKNNILLILDEIFTGFYRTGTLYAYQQADITPDILCLSKGITGGFLPLAVTLSTEEIFSAFVSDKQSKALLHGHSYTANPIACAAALASWKILNERKTQERIQRIAQITQERLEALQVKCKGKVEAVRSLGTIGALSVKEHLVDSKKFSYAFFEKALEKGVLLRPLGNVVYVVPPYVTTDEQMCQIYDVIEEILEEY